MKSPFDLKSALCGVVVGVLAMLAIGAGTSSDAPLKYGTGRYQVAVGANVALVIDTQTGKLWTKCWNSTSEFTADEDFFKPKLVVPETSETK